jgi:hypothetical protein
MIVETMPNFWTRIAKSAVLQGHCKPEIGKRLSKIADVMPNVWTQIMKQAALR